MTHTLYSLLIRLPYNLYNHMDPPSQFFHINHQQSPQSQTYQYQKTQQSTDAHRSPSQDCPIHVYPYHNQVTYQNQNYFPQQNQQYQQYQQCQQYHHYLHPNPYQYEPLVGSNQFHHQFPNPPYFGGQGRGRGRGRGRFHHPHPHQMEEHQGSYEKPCWEQKGKVKKQNNWKKQHQKRSSSSSSESSEDREIKSLQKNLQNISLKPKKMSKIMKAQQFRDELLIFLERYAVPQHTTNKLINFLVKRYDSPDDLVWLKETLCELEQESPTYFQSPYLNLFKISKVIIKNAFDIKKINGKLDKKLFLKNKRKKKDIEFYSKYPNPIPIKFLELQDLYQISLADSVFLVDGNNVMQKQKIFRFYFDSLEEEKKSEGQVRMQWLLGETLHSELFFDNKYQDSDYEKAKTSILNQEALENTNKIPVHFADKHLIADATADDKIVERLAQIVMRKEFPGKYIILVSADRQLAQRCVEIAPIMQTSGYFFFKFCKQVIKDKYYHRPEMKGIIKRIFTIRDS